MRIIFSFLVALLLFACNNSATKKQAPEDTAKPTAQMPPPPPAAEMNDTIFTALGTEPFWSVHVIKDSKIIFSNADGDIVEVPFVAAINEDDGRRYSSSADSSSIEMHIIKKNCSDGMSEITYPYSVELKVNKKEFTGCGTDE